MKEIRKSQFIKKVNGQTLDCSGMINTNKLFKFPKNFNIFLMQRNEVIVYPSNHIIEQVNLKL